jgi:plasmid stabilization system protein ParE
VVRKTGRSVKRFVLSEHAHRDLDELLSYLDSLPDKPALLIASSIQEALHSISQYPYLGAIQSELTRLAGVEIRSRLVQSYRIFYMVGDAPEVIGVLHGTRDITSIMARRIQ